MRADLGQVAAQGVVGEADRLSAPVCGRVAAQQVSGEMSYCPGLSRKRLFTYGPRRPERPLRSVAAVNTLIHNNN